MRRLGGRPLAPPGAPGRLRRVRDAARPPGRRADAGRAAAHAYLRGRARAGAGGCSRAPTSPTAPTPSRRAGSSSRWWPSTRRSTPRPCSRPSRCCRPAPTGPPARRALPAAAAVRARAGWRSPAGRFAMGADGGGFAYDCERPRHAPRAGAVPDRPRPRHRGRAPRVHRRRGLRAAASSGPARAGSGASGEGAEAPLYWERDGEGGWLVRRFDRRGARRAGAAAVPRQRARGRRPRALGRRAAAHRGRVGARRPGRRAPATAVRQRRTSWVSARRRRARTAAAPSGCRQMIGDVWEWTASALRGLPGLPAPSRTASTPRSSSAPRYRVLRGGSWATQPIAAARPASATGTCPSGARSSAGLRLRAGRRVTHRPRPAALPARRASAGRRRRGPRRRRPRRADGAPEVAAAEVLLRRARLGAVRAHHPAARVLPDAAPSCAILTPHRRAGSSRVTAWASWWSSARASSRKTRGPARRDARRAARCERYVPVRRLPGGDPRGARRLAEDYPGLDVHGVAGDFGRHLPACPRQRRRRGWWRSSAARSATSSPASARPSCARWRELLGRRRPAADGHRPRGRPGAHPSRLRRRRGGDGASSTCNLLRVLNRELDADFDLDAFAHVAIYDAEPAVDRDAAALARGPGGRGCARST